MAEFIDPEDKQDIVSLMSWDVKGLFNNVDPFQAAFKQLIPTMVNVLEQVLKNSDEKNAAEIFEVFDNLFMLVSLSVMWEFSIKDRSFTCNTGYSFPF